MLKRMWKVPNRIQSGDKQTEGQDNGGYVADRRGDTSERAVRHHTFDMEEEINPGRVKVIYRCADT